MAAKRPPCVECGKPIPSRCNYLFFCSKTCAADWGEDEALFHYLARQQLEKEGKYDPRTFPEEYMTRIHEHEKRRSEITFADVRKAYDTSHPHAKLPQ